MTSVPPTSATRPSTSDGQTWNAQAYAQNGRFVASLASDIVALLAPEPGEHLLDLGCGDGALTAELAATGAHVLGLDASAAMVAAAHARGLEILHGSATDLPFSQRFDAVFSNAALHWIPEVDQPRLLAGVFRALRPGGRFVAEMGGQGNIAAIRTALSAVLLPLGLDAETIAASFFPSPGHYRQLLEAAGFTVHELALHPRPTPLPGGAGGMELWLGTFRNGVLDRLPPADRQQAVARIIRLLQPVLADRSGDWTADYVRLRFRATRPPSPETGVL